MLNHQECLERWQQVNFEGYTKDGDDKDTLIIDIIKRFFPDNCNIDILDLGCGVGRTMSALMDAGYENSYGVELISRTEELSKAHYPNLWDDGEGQIEYNSIELYLSTVPANHQFDVIYSLASLEHINPDVEYHFAEIPKHLKPGGILITVEDELNLDEMNFVFRRHYGSVFEPAGMIQVEEHDCGSVPGLKEGYYARVFQLHDGEGRQ